MLCRICRSDKLDIFIRFDSVPARVERLLQRDELDQDKPIPMDVFQCTNCGFIQLERFLLPRNYYARYEQSPVFSETMRVYQQALAVELIKTHSLSGKKILEAGCGDGYFASLLVNLGADVTAIEPGEPAAKMARDRGIRVINDYFSRNLPLEQKSFDCFLSRLVISHIEDICGFMTAAKHFLKPGGLGIVEFVNVRDAIETNRFFDFFPDYVNYFTPASFVQLLHRTGFDLISVSPCHNNEYSLAAFSSPQEDSFSFFEKSEQYKEQIRTIIEDRHSRGRRMACWGAGGRGTSLLVMSGIKRDRIAYVVDSSPSKQGLFTPGSHVPVYPPAHLLEDPVDTVIITAINFQNEIKGSLLRDFNFQGEVVLLSPNPQIVSRDSTAKF